MDSSRRSDRSPPRRRSTTLILVVVGLLLLTPTRGLAQTKKPTAAAVETARHLMDVGHDSFESGNFEKALKSFQAAHDIMGLTVTGLEVGRAFMKLGRLIEARNVLLQTARIKAQPGETQPLKKARSEAMKLQATIADRIPTLTVTISDEHAGRLYINDVEVAASLVGQPQKLNPGKHLVRLEAPGHAATVKTVQLKERSQQSVKLAFGPKEVSSQGGSAASLPMMSWVGFGVATAGVIAGGITGGLALGEASKAKEGCQNGICPSANEEAQQSALTLAHTSTVSFALAGVGAAVGTIGLFLFPTNAKEDASGSEPTTRLRIGLGHLGFETSFQ